MRIGCFFLHIFETHNILRVIATVHRCGGDRAIGIFLAFRVVAGETVEFKIDFFFLHEKNVARSVSCQTRLKTNRENPHAVIAVWEPLKRYISRSAKNAAKTIKNRFYILSAAKCRIDFTTERLILFQQLFSHQTVKLQSPKKK